MSDFRPTLPEHWLLDRSFTPPRRAIESLDLVDVEAFTNRIRIDDGGMRLIARDPADSTLREDFQPSGRRTGLIPVHHTGGLSES